MAKEAETEPVEACFPVFAMGGGGGFVIACFFLVWGFGVRFSGIGGWGGGVGLGCRVFFLLVGVRGSQSFWYEVGGLGEKEFEALQRFRVWGLGLIQRDLVQKKERRNLSRVCCG